MNPELRSIAGDRLAQSRLDIAHWFAAEAAQAAAGALEGAEAPASSRTRLAGLALNAVADGLLRRPAQSPTQALAHAGGDAAQALLRPLAREHPWALVGVAAVAGAALVAGRPWRWLLRPALLGSLFSQLAVHALTRAAAPVPQERDPHDPPLR